MATNIDMSHEGTLIVAMESTACDPHHASLPELSGLSSITSQSELVDGSEQQLRVYLRVRPFSKEELNNNEDQGCVVLESTETAALHAPKGSATMKSSEKGIGQQLHKFSFTKIFGAESTQAEFFDGTIRSQVQDFLQGRNALVFSYGVTNAGKTHTIQGSPKDPGILPRALEVVFRHISGRMYEHMDLRPYLSSDVQQLDPDQIRAERCAKAALFSLLKEESESSRNCRSRSSSSSSINSLSFSGVSYDQTVDSVEVAVDNLQSLYSLWVAYYEIYNEQVYDLLQPSLTNKTKRRPALRVCEDSAGNSYVRDLRWVNIQAAEEANKVLRVGNKNRSAAATKMNQSSSRSHSIFTIKLMRIDGGNVHGISELSLCDLAGSERCNKTKTFGERLKEAGNINNSLLILGKCIAALRSQNDRAKSSYVPFRESKLTRLFQGVFCGRGKASMIVNINQCASTYDETLHVMKFSAVAKEVLQVIPPRSLESLAPRLIGRDGKPLLSNSVIDGQAVDDYLSEDELLDGDDDADMSILPQEELLSLVESLRGKLLAERKKNLQQEIQIRREMGDAMLQQIMEMEEIHSRQMADLKENYEEKMDSTFDMYKEALKEHAYQCALERLEDDYVTLEEYTEVQDRAKELERRVNELEWTQEGSAPATATPASAVKQDDSTQTDPVQSATEEIDSDRFKLLYKEKCAVEQLCAEKQELIVSLEKRLHELNETLQEAGESYMEKLTEVQNLQNKLNYQEREAERLQRELTDKRVEVQALKEEVTKLMADSAGPPRQKRGLLVNIKESVSTPSTGNLCRTIRKSVRTTTTSLRKKPS